MLSNKLMILLSSSSDIDNDKFNILEYYFKKIDDIYVDPIIFAEFTVILLTAYLIRLLLFYRIENDKFKQANKKFTRGNKAFLFGHICIELLISYVICYLVVKFTNANPESYIVNCIIAPAIGMMAGIWLDTKFIMPLNLVDQVDQAFHLYKKKKDSSSSSSNGNSNSVILNFNGTTPTTENKKPKTESPLIKHIDKSLASDEDFNEKIIDVINEIKDTQATHSEQLQGVMDSLDVLKQDSMINKKAALKKMIYECLNQGYATPEQNDKIEMYYKSYRALDGNGEVEALYMLHYVKLPIHEHGVIQAPTYSVVADANVKEITGPIYYGMYDNEQYDGE